MTNYQKNIIDLYFEEKLRPVDIANKLNISKSAVTQVLKIDKRYKEEKEIRKQKNKIKHNEDTKEYVKNTRIIAQFNRKIDDLVLKALHEQAARELSKRGKLSNLAYRKWNISAYDYDEEHKRFVFKKELGRSADVPKYIKVEV